MALSPSQSSQIKNALEPPRVGGDLHSIVEALRKEIAGKMGRIPTAEEMQKIEQQLHLAATKAIADNPRITQDAVRDQYESLQNPQAISDKQMQQAAGVTPVAQKANSEQSQLTPAEEASRAPAYQGDQSQNITQATDTRQNTGYVPMQGGGAQAAANRARPMDGASQKPGGGSTAQRNDAGGKQEKKASGESEQAKAPEAAARQETSSAKRTSGSEQNDYLAPGMMPDKDAKGKADDAKGKSPLSENARTTHAPEAGGSQHPGPHGNSGGGGAAQSMAGKKSPMPLKVNPEQVKQAMASLRQGNPKETVRFAAQQAADKAFWALLDASPADLGILTIGLGGTTLLVLGHMFNVQLQTWEKWLIILYDVLLVILLLFIVAILILGFCTTAGTFTSECSGMRFWNVLF